MNNQANITSFKKGHRQSEASREKMSLAKLGKPTWNKGKKLSLEHIEKLRKSHLGQKPTYSIPKGNIPWNKGIGTKTTEAQRIRVSLAYEAWRKDVFIRDKFTCQFCGEVGGKLNADHIKRFSDYPELRLELSNGRTLCEPCHRTTDTFGRKRVSTDTKWDLIASAQEA